MPALRCPVDRANLDEQTIGAAAIATCGICGGIWLTRTARTAPSVDPSLLPEVTRKRGETAMRIRKFRACPVCSQNLKAQRIDGIEIDRCIKCDGIWLDSGEYDAVRHRIEIGRKPVSAAATGETGKRRLSGLRKLAEPEEDRDAIGAPLDLVVQAILAFLECLP